MNRTRTTFDTRETRKEFDGASSITMLGRGGSAMIEHMSILKLRLKARSDLEHQSIKCLVCGA